MARLQPLLWDRGNWKQLAGAALISANGAVPPLQMMLSAGGAISPLANKGPRLGGSQGQSQW